MSTSVLFNGVTYSVPATGEESWGESLTSYLTAIASGCLQKTGGTFTLTADTNFGANYGLLSKYFSTRSSNPSTSGLMRLSVSDTIGWRNNANGANLLLAVNGSNQLTFDGTAIYTAGITALTGDVTATGPGSVAATLATVNSNVGTFVATTLNGKGLVTAGANMSGDVTTSGAVATLATVNSNVGTFASVTVNGKGLVTAAANLSGDITTSSAVSTLATVNSNVGSFTFSSITVNAKGLVTAASSASVTTSPTASSFAGWDANKNLSANSFIEGYTTTATAAATTTLLVGSTEGQYFTGSTTQTCKLPLTSTLALNQRFKITNLSSGVVTVQSSGSNTLQAMVANTVLIVEVISTSGTGTSSWNWSYQAVQNSLSGGGSVTSVGIVPTNRFTASSAVTSAGNITLTSTVINAQVASYSLTSTDSIVTFTGTRNATLPTAVSSSGIEYTIKNAGTGVITLLTTSSQTIDGYASGVIKLATAKDSITIVSDGSNWIIKNFNVAVTVFANTSNTAATTSAPFVYTNVVTDTQGIYNNSTGVATIAIAGTYSYLGQAYAGATSFTLYMYLSGTQADQAGTGSSASQSSQVSGIRRFAINDTIEFRPDLNATSSGGAAISRFCLSRISD